MNKCLWSKSIFSALLAVCALASPVKMIAAEQDECSKEILLAYFPKIFVDETLARFNVPKDQWDAINKELGEKDKDIIKIVESKASKMNPNPLKDPQQRQVAVKIFRETLFDSFSSVMKAHGVSDDKQIQSMLDDIQQQKAKRFARCMEAAQKSQPQQSSPANPPPVKITSGQPTGTTAAPAPTSEEDIDDEDDED